MVLLIDNYDSFTHNLWHLLASCGAEVRIVRNDVLSSSQALALKPSHIVLSPRPGGPERAGICLELLRVAQQPVLGVCLGHQCLGASFGARVTRAPWPVHGRREAMYHTETGLFRGLSQGFQAARYHSLVVQRESLPQELELSAWTDSGLVMGLRHKELPLFGVQFHPESVLTTAGQALVRNFLEGV